MNKINIIIMSFSLISFNNAYSNVNVTGDASILAESNLVIGREFVEKALADANQKKIAKEARKNAVDENNQKLSEVICEAFDTGKSAENHSLKVEHTKSSCDLGLRLPNLDDFNGLKLGKFDICSAVQAITGDTVDGFNSNISDNIQGMLDEGMDTVNDAAELDLNEVASGAANIDAGSSKSKETIGKVELDVRKPIFGGDK